jgi:hypothetical protein
MFNKLEARVLSEYKRSRAAPSTFCTLIKLYFSFIKHYLQTCFKTVIFWLKTAVWNITYKTWNYPVCQAVLERLRRKTMSLDFFIIR